LSLTAILDRVQKFAQLCKRAQLKAFNPVPFSSLTARSDFAANERFAPEDPNEYTLEEQRLIQMLLDNMSESAKRTVKAVTAARQNPAR
jgi:hypothetical protein